MLKISDFNYNLPSKFIAQERIHPYEKARLLVYNRQQDEILHRHITNLPDLLNENDVLVFNNSQVIPARLHGYKEKTGGRVEILLLRDLGGGKWSSLVKPGCSVHSGVRIGFPDSSLRVEIIEDRSRGERVVNFSLAGKDFWQEIEKIGEMPLPPYIHKKISREERGEYRTCYAQEQGSVAAPTAGLHFTPQLLEKIKSRRILTEFVTLHVGLGTFAPISEEEIKSKKLHSEFFTLKSEVAERLNKAKKQGKRIIAVGTTTVRVLESCIENNFLQSRSGETNIFIQSGDQFKFTDAIMTNFHLPQSSLLMLVAAFIGQEKILDLYETAKKSNYRFFSFGDACLFL